MDRWRNKVAVVTGASSGIGAAICENLLKHDIQVVGLARRADRMKQLKEKLPSPEWQSNFHPLCTDVTSEQQLIGAFEWIAANLGPVSILINNAGVLRDTHLVDGQTELWRQVIDTNVMAVCIATREALKSMAKEPVGQIVHVNSVFGQSNLYARGLNVYGASKHAISNLTETLRRELLERNLRNVKITSLSPGIVRTEIFDNGSEEFKRIGHQEDAVLECEDIANGIEYVLSTPNHVQIHELTIKPIGESF